MDLARISKVVSIIARYGFGSFIADTSLPGLSKVTGAEESAKKPAPERFSLMLEEMGPIFIKFGQLLSTRPDVLPPDFITALTTLQEDVTKLPWNEIETQLETHLPAKPDAIFEYIDTEPLATASVSQVHLARLKNGQEVVVKVRRPEIDEIIHSDIQFLRTITKFLKRTIVEISRHDPEKWIDEFAKALDKELDLMNEVKAIETFRANGSETGELVVPKVYREYSSSRIIVMEYVKGIPVTKVADKNERKRMARIIVAEAYKQVFVDGFFHADPHPGNVRYLDNGKLGMIDFGLCGRLSPRMRELIIRLSMSIAFRDADTVAKIVYSAGVTKDRVDLAALSRDINEVFGDTMGKALEEIDTEHVALQLMSIISKHNVTLPRDMALLGKAGVHIEGVIRTLDPEIDISKEGLPYAKKMMAMPDDPKALMNEALKQFVRLKGMVEEVPLQVDQIMMDVSSGKLNINISSRQLDGLVPAIRELGALLAIGMVAAASVVTAALLVVPYFGEATFYSVPVLPVLAIAMVAYAFFLMTAVISWALLRGRDMRIRLGNWLPIFRKIRERRAKKKAKAAKK